MIPTASTSPARALALLALLCLALPITAEAQTGTIQGLVSFEQAPPPRRTANRYPGGASASHEIQPVPAVVYLLGAVPGGDNAATRPVMAQRDTAFAPAVVTVRAGGTVSFPNGDPFFHNVFSYSSAQRFDLGRYPQGESKEVTFPEAGIVEVFCEVHEFMRGAILVAANSFHAVVGSDGSFRISGVPEGTHTLAIWHPDFEAIEHRVVVTSGGIARVEVELQR
ncbi:MAG: DUF2012 domain-containing protein [Longimicrobiales bacterium]